MTIRWLQWLLGASPAIVALALPGDDFRASGAMTLFAVTPATYFALVFTKRTWRAHKPSHC
jgi:hypothetical protein